MIDVIIPAYNAYETIERTLKSIEKQTIKKPGKLKMPAAFLSLLKKDPEPQTEETENIKEEEKPNEEAAKQNEDEAPKEEVVNQTEEQAKTEDKSMPKEETTENVNRNLMKCKTTSEAEDISLVTFSSFSPAPAFKVSFICNSILSSGFWCTTATMPP